MADLIDRKAALALVIDPQARDDIRAIPAVTPAFVAEAAQGGGAWPSAPVGCSVSPPIYHRYPLKVINIGGSWHLRKHQAVAGVSVTLAEFGDDLEAALRRIAEGEG